MSGSKVQLRVPSSPMFPVEVKVVTVMECVPAIQEARINAKGSFRISRTEPFITKSQTETPVINSKYRRTGEA